MRVALSSVLALALAACGVAPSGNPSVARAVSAGGGICPDPDPVRDGPLVDAIRADDATSVEAALARAPDDPRARAAFAVISGEGRPDPNQAACFAPYFA